MLSQPCLHCSVDGQHAGYSWHACGTSEYSQKACQRSVPLQAIEHAVATSGQANKRALARKHLIEKRKEEQERLLLEQEREQEEQRMIQLRISEEAEEKRRKADM